MAIEGYYYLHANGDLIYKRAGEGLLEDFSNSDLIKHYWPIDPSDRAHAWLMLIEATAMGANASRVAELAQKWHCDNADALEFAKRCSGMELENDGKVYRASFKMRGGDEYMGEGSDYLHAMADQLLEMRKRRTKQQRLAAEAKA